MQLRKFHGRTMSGALARVKRELGPEAMILETRQIDSDSATARMNPGARFEIRAVVEPQPDASGQASLPGNSGGKPPHST